MVSLFLGMTLFRALAVLLCAHLAASLENGRALLPPMGWLSWERFRCNVNCSADPQNCLSEHLIRAMSKHLVDDGFAGAGYRLVGIDDCWLARSRDDWGRLQADPDRFPSGVKALADDVHSKGLDFGIYGDIGTKTCGGYPGMAGSLELDARTYAEWGVDYLKVDGCYAQPEKFGELYPKLGRLLNATGRPITYSCSWPAYLPDPVSTRFEVPYAALRKHCNLWRNWVDIQDSYDSLASIIGFWAEASLKSEGFQSVAGPGSWNDPDMLIIGNKGLSQDQGRVQMGMWAIFAAPLLMSNDLRNLESSARATLLNREAIAINQDPLGIQGALVRCIGGCRTVQLWRRQLLGDKLALAFLNLSHKAIEGPFCIHTGDMGLHASAFEGLQVTDVFRSSSDSSAEVRPGSVCIHKLRPTSLRLFRTSSIHQWPPHLPSAQSYSGAGMQQIVATS